MGRFERITVSATVLIVAGGWGAAPDQALPPSAGASIEAQAATSSVATAAQAPAAPSAPVDPVTDLLQRVDALYQAGVKDYSAGNLNQAKDEFDQAVSLLLGSNFDLQSNDRLSHEFDSLVENIYSLEVAALERGDTMSSHTYEPAPIESFAGLTFPVDPNVRERAEQELTSVRSDLPLVSNDYVDGALTFLQNHGRKFIQTVLERRGYYGPMIEKTLQQEDLPQDLIYLAAGESAFNPFAVSRRGAKGIWQFMDGTAGLYGLKKNRWVDEREDPVKSSAAAARHLKDLYRTFGDWYLAMAAYDWNPGGVEKAIEKTGYADYWKLRELHALPAETENYVPVFLAIALIAKDPNAYGFDVPADPPAAVDEVTVSEPTDLRLVAGLIDRPVEDLVRLNPSMLTWVTPPNEPNFVLKLPAGAGAQFQKAIAAIPPGGREWWRAYRLGPGESLASVAHKFHISPVSLTRANQLSSQVPLQAGSRVLVPLAPSSPASLVRMHERTVRRARRYRVRPGDTLGLVADRFDVTPYEIRRWNHLRGSHLVVGRDLVVYVSVPVRLSRHSRPRRTTPSTGRGALGRSSAPAMAATPPSGR